MSWVLHSMQPNIVWGYMVLSIVEEIWSAAPQTYLQLGNNVQVYELVKNFTKQSQGKEFWLNAILIFVLPGKRIITEKTLGCLCFRHQEPQLKS